MSERLLFYFKYYLDKLLIMRIRFQKHQHTALDFEFGFNTSLFKSMHWFTITKVYFDTKGEVEFAAMVFYIFKHPKFWKC